MTTEDGSNNVKNGSCWIDGGEKVKNLYCAECIETMVLHWCQTIEVHGHCLYHPRISGFHSPAIGLEQQVMDNALSDCRKCLKYLHIYFQRDHVIPLWFPCPLGGGNEPEPKYSLNI